MDIIEIAPVSIWRTLMVLAGIWTIISVESSHIIKQFEWKATNEVTYMGKCMDNYDCRPKVEYCNYGICDCRPGTKFDPLLQTCTACEESGLPCSECCIAAGFGCIANVCIDCYEYGTYRCWNDFDPPPQQTPIVYITASQIALSAALIMGSIALITLLYRICSKPASTSASRIRSTQFNGAEQSAFQRLSERMSLTSMQIRILARLRDQPPKYETQHNYDNRLRQDSERQVDTPNQSTDPSSQLPIVSTVSGTIISMPLGIAPPAYEDDQYSLSSLPPPYVPSTNTTSFSDLESASATAVTSNTSSHQTRT